MNDIDNWLNSLTRAYKEELEEAIAIELKLDLKKYGEILERAILKTWDNYMNSYSPSVYKRTGRTRRSIVLDKNVKIGSSGKLEIAVQFIDSYVESMELLSHERRNTFLAIDQGWMIDLSEPENFGYAHGHNLTGEIRNTIESILPDYIHFDFVGANII